MLNIKNLTVLLGLFLFSCSHFSASPEVSTNDQVERAARNNFSGKIYQTSNFKLFAMEKLTDTTSDINIYIEGDGRAWKTKYKISDDPTPSDSIPLKLAIKDKAPNVIYYGRPCQYRLEDPKCEPKYWSSGRFAQEVIDSYKEVLSKYDNRKINFIGYSGGAAVAILLAADMKNVNHITTIAGNLDHKAFTEHHKHTPLHNSLDMDSAIKAVSNIPQKHYIGGRDKVITRAVSDSFQSKLLPENKAEFFVAPDATHSKGWEILGNKSL